MDMNTNAQAMSGHASLMSLVPESAVTHKAIRNGSWFNSSTWAEGRVPGDNANVMIAEGVRVSYDGQSDAQLKTVRVDGTLAFASNTDTQMVVDTLINMPSGTLSIGTRNNPIRADKTASIIIDGDGKIDTRWDPTQLSRGVISHGQVDIFGADKTDFIALREDAEAGDRELILDGVPQGWRVGDKLVLGGTQYKGSGSDSDNSRFGDEELTITRISGNRVSFTNDDIRSGNREVLRFDHVRPDIPEKDRTKLYVANTTRNATIETKDGEGLPADQRGHVMFMHNPNVRVNNAGFYHLGRSDKSRLVDDPGRNIDGSAGRGSNPRGRYSLHFHRTGAEDINGQAAEANGNAVVGSPGWGIVHHDSHANLANNVVFDVVGSGIAAETGNELGSWKNNLAIKITGPGRNLNSNQVEERERKFDLGFRGEGYWVQGAAQVVMEDNIAVSANDAGITIFGDGQNEEARDKGTILVKNLPRRIQDLFPAGQTEVDITDVPLNQLTGFQSYNTGIGIRVWSHLADFDGQLELNNRRPNASHEGRATIDSFTVWQARVRGLATDYSSNIDFVDGLIVGDVEKPSGDGIVHNQASNGLRYDNLTVRGFDEGYSTRFPDVEKKDIATMSIENSTFGNNTYNLAEIGELKQNDGVIDDYAALLKIDNTDFQITSNNQLPVAKFSSAAVGGLSATFDASESYDTDRQRSPVPSNGIASYGWDFNNDGKLDDFGRQVTHHFKRAGNQQVSLQVLDSQGAAQTIAQTVNVSPTAYTNPFVDGDIDSRTQLITDRRLSSLTADAGWQATRGVRQNGGQIELATTQDRRSGLGQVIQNDGLHKGEQTLSFELRNVEGSGDSKQRNKVTVQLWGVDGQLDGQLTGVDGPLQSGKIPMVRKLLFEETYVAQRGQPVDREFAQTVDLGNGYQHLVAKIETDATNDRGDSVALDYFELSTEGAAPRNLPITSSAPITSPEADPPAPAPQPAPVEQTVPAPPSELQPGNQPPDQSSLHQLPSLIAQFDFDEGSGRVAADSSKFGDKHISRFVGKTSWQEGLTGKGVAFENASDRVNLSQSRSINLETHGQRTVSLWFNADQISKDSGRQVIYEEGGNVRGLNIYLEDDKLLVGGWNTPRKESRWAGTWLETDNVSADTWHHVSLVLDGSDKLAPDALRGYIDGKQFGSGEGAQLGKHPDGIGIGGVANTTRFRDGLSRGSGLVGAVDNVSIFNEALSANQIESLANQDLL